MCTLLISCTSRPPANRDAVSRLDSSKIDTATPIKTDEIDTFKIIAPDTLLNLTEADTGSCGGIINTLFHRSLYKFPVDSSFHKDELRAVITEAGDSLLMVKIMYADSTTNDGMTVDWLRLNCKNKRLTQIRMDDPDAPWSPVNYDVRLLEILMRKCTLDY
jgi:hypothetical protein